MQKQSNTPIKDNSSLQVLYDLRYMFMMCGVFSMYAGLIYNEYLGFPLDLFGSCYEGEVKVCTYPLGFDPAMASSLTFSNSVKMKLSIILGFLQMTLGIIAYGMNAHFRADYVSLLLVFPSRLLFFCCTVGYMVFCIVLKWLK